MAAYLCLLSICAALFSLSSAVKHYVVTEEVWFDVEVKAGKGDEEDYRGRFVVGVFGDTVPITVMNFMAIAKGFKPANAARSRKLYYKNTPIHRVVADFLIQMGDITLKTGAGGTSIYGQEFADENFLISHKAAGYVSMANRGPDTNGSQFYILLNRARWLDGKHVVFGKVVTGMDVVNYIGELDIDKTQNPKRKTTIIDCGIVGIEKKYELNDTQTLSNEDLIF